MAAKEKVSNISDPAETGDSADVNAPVKKKVVKKVIRKVVKKKPTVEDPKKAAIKKATATVDSRDHDIRSDYLDKEVPLEKSNLRIYMISIGVMVIFIFITLGLVYAKAKIETNRLSDAEAESEATPVVEEEVFVDVEEVEEDDESEVVVLEPEEITLEILNGSGVAGLAGDTQEEFEDLGYVVESIGNADETEQSQLFISSDYSEEELENLLDDVDRRLGIEEVSGSLSDLDTIARIVIGSE